MNKKLFTLLILLLLSLSFTFFVNTVDAATPFSLSKSQATIYVGNTLQLKAFYLGKTKPSWTSSNPKVATINKKTGLIHAKNTGKTTITASLKGQKRTCSITVSPHYLTLNKRFLTIKKGRTAYLIPKSTTGTTKGIVWTATSSKILKVHPSTGKITAIAPGVGYVYANLHGLLAKCMISVTA
ncbi:bacterial surface protein [Lachnospiraceae bacterium TWA4]|nr:bacterial surface protein [Lachnospiraceae bacterium TWA4]